MAYLYTLAFPKLSQQDQNWVDRIREENDPDCQKVRPHFTLLFGCGDVSVEVYTQHIENTAKATSSFEFHACRVAVGIDHFGSGGYAFLVPDQGHSSVLALHDRLYSGPLSLHLNLKLPFIPHITLGKCESLDGAKKLCDELNFKAISVSGIIDSIAIVEEKDGNVKIREEFTLSATG